MIISSPCISHDNSPCRYKISFEEVVLCETVCNTERYDQMPPQNLFAKSSDVGQVLSVFIIWKPVGSHHIVELVLGPLLGFWEKNHGEKEYMKYSYRLEEYVMILVSPNGNKFTKLVPCLIPQSRG